MPSSELDVVQTLAEKMMDKIDRAYEEAPETVYAMVKGGQEVPSAGRKAIRRPVMLGVPRAASKMSYNGQQALPRGIGLETVAYFQGTIPVIHAHELTMEQVKSAKLANQAVDSEDEAFVQMLANVMIWDDINFHQPGDGILAGRTGGTIVSSGTYNGRTRTVITFDPSVDNQRIDLLTQGMTVEMANSALNTRRQITGSTSATPQQVYIYQIDYNPSAPAVILSESMASAANGDVLVVPGLLDPSAPFTTGYQGATSPYTWGNSAWPNGTSSAFGYTGDSYRHGYQYATQYSGSAFFNGLQLSQVPYLQAVGVNAAGNAFSEDFVLRMFMANQQKAGGQAYAALRGLIHPVQVIQVQRAATAVVQTNKFIEQTYGKIVDTVAENVHNLQTVTIGGIQHIIDRRVSRTDIPYLIPGNIGECVMEKLKVMDESDLPGLTADGRFSVISGTVGTPNGNIVKYSYSDKDFMYSEPGKNALIYGLATPAGF